jgi:hypothetical protein
MDILNKLEVKERELEICYAIIEIQSEQVKTFKEKILHLEKLLKFEPKILNIEKE